MSREPFYRSKFLLGLVATGMITGCWRWAVFHLYALPPEAYPAFQAITGQMMWAVTAIALTIAGVKGVQQMLAQKLDLTAAATTAAAIEKSTVELKIDPRFQTPELMERYANR